MKAKLAASAALLILLAAVGWPWFAAERAPPAIPQRPPVAQATKHALALGALKGRVLLDDAQVRQAVASGTLDRPVKSLLKVGGPMQFGDYRWDDAAVPPGPVWVRVDLGKQLLSVFRGGHEIGTSVIVYGGDNKQTPPGTLHVLSKARDHRSSLYDAEMPFTLRLTHDGVSIHGSSVKSGKATHGCVGVPLAFAERLFNTVEVGDEVVILPPRKAAPINS